MEALDLAIQDTKDMMRDISIGKKHAREILAAFALVSLFGGGLPTFLGVLFYLQTGSILSGLLSGGISFMILFVVVMFVVCLLDRLNIL